jgi:hypothetical protein
LKCFRGPVPRSEVAATAVGDPSGERFPFGQCPQLSFNPITLVLAKNFFLWEVFERADRGRLAGLLALNYLLALHFAQHVAMAPKILTAAYRY